jgi:hypothetical protein
MTFNITILDAQNKPFAYRAANWLPRVGDVLVFDRVIDAPDGEGDRGCVSYHELVVKKVKIYLSRNGDPNQPSVRVYTEQV